MAICPLEFTGQSGQSSLRGSARHRIVDAFCRGYLPRSSCSNQRVAPVLILMGASSLQRISRETSTAVGTSQGLTPLSSIRSSLISQIAGHNRRPASSENSFPHNCRKASPGERFSSSFRLTRTREHRKGSWLSIWGDSSNDQKRTPISNNQIAGAEV